MGLLAGNHERLEFGREATLAVYRAQAPLGPNADIDDGMIVILGRRGRFDDGDANDARNLYRYVLKPRRACQISTKHPIGPVLS